MYTKFFITLVLCLAVITAQAANIPQAGKIFQIGGSPSTSNFNPSFTAPPESFANGKVYMVIGTGPANGGTTAHNYNLFSKQGGAGAVWSVPSGSRATCVAMNLYAVGTPTIQFGYATASFTTGATGATGAKCFNTTGTCAAGDEEGGYQVVTTSIQVPQPLILNFDATASGANATIYPFYRTSAGVTANLPFMCYEQTGT